jgi:hypothetical protein
MRLVFEVKSIWIPSPFKIQKCYQRNRRQAILLFLFLRVAICRLTIGLIRRQWKLDPLSHIHSNHAAPPIS